MTEPRQRRRSELRGRTGWGRCTLALMLVLGLASVAPAATFGDIDVTVEDSPRGPTSHGYGEVWMRVVNKSTTTAREVRLSVTGLGYTSMDHIRDVSRTITIDPGKASRVSLAYPERLLNSANGVTVTIDGSEQKNKVPLLGSGPSGMARGYGGPPPPLVLYSKAVDTRFPDWVNRPARFGGIGRAVECVRAVLPAAEWGPNWIGYTRYDGIVLTADDLRQMPGEVRSAIAQYVECGGSLFVLGAAPQLPAQWKPGPVARPEAPPLPPELVPPPEIEFPVPLAQPPFVPKFGPQGGGRPEMLASVSGCLVGFGQCLVTEQTDLSGWDFEQIGAVTTAWTQTLQPWQSHRAQGDANRAFPVIDDLGIPVNGLLLLMFVFSFVIGPLNLYLLTRIKRKLWFFWTVPLMSLITCVAVFGYTAIREGWDGRSRIEGVTILDENSRRASTIGWSAFYTPLMSGGLHFSPDTEVSTLNEDDISSPYGHRSRGGGNALTIDWTQDQHLVSGWLTPRVPSHFAIRKGESRRERVTIGKGAGGLPEAVNGLGADITELWYRDEAKKLYSATNIPAGGRITLELTQQPPAPGGLRTLRSLYLGDWPGHVKRLQSEGVSYLRPRTYMATLDSAPFLDDGINKRATKKAQSIVFGILKEGGDEG